MKLNGSGKNSNIIELFFFIYKVFFDKHVYSFILISSSGHGAAGSILIFFQVSG